MFSWGRKRVRVSTRTTDTSRPRRPYGRARRPTLGDPKKAAMARIIEALEEQFERDEETTP